MEFNDVIPELPEVQEKDLHVLDLTFAVKELEQAQNIFLLYENKEGEIRLFFDKLSAPLYACIVAKLVQVDQQKVYEFLKLAMEGVRMFKKGNKKANALNNRIEKYIESCY